ncbi:hypothetical protein FQR65_LT20038 [Abscondita terminalis]|nr:hypothetical protein FQR65_LT20038 [Abscondita terminalis]
MRKQNSAFRHCRKGGSDQERPPLVAQLPFSKKSLGALHRRTPLTLVGFGTFLQAPLAAPALVRKPANRRTREDQGQAYPPDPQHSVDNQEDTDDHHHQQEADKESDEHGQLKIQCFLAVSIDKGIRLTFHLPANQRADQRAEWNHESK